MALDISRSMCFYFWIFLFTHEMVASMEIAVPGGTHAVVGRALGGCGGTLLDVRPNLESILQHLHPPH